MHKTEQQFREIFAQQAEEEGNALVAKLFRAAVQLARKDGDRVAELTFADAIFREEISRVSRQTTQEDHDSLNEVEYYGCAVCGFILEHKPLENCPSCTAKPKSYFKVA